jgi:ABC-type uncharacterized transport system substrate-binding protein
VDREQAVGSLDPPLGADVLIAAGDQAAKAAQHATGRLPIIFIGDGNDPVTLGLVRTFNRPGGNITGIVDLDVTLGPKRLEIFREIIPGLKRVLLPYDATDDLRIDRIAQLALHNFGVRHLRRAASARAR